MADRKHDDEPEPVVEASELLESLYGFDNDDESNRYAMAEQLRDDAVRLVVLHFHLTSEELLKAMTYNALRRVEGPETFTEDQDIAHLQALGSADTIDLAARLGASEKTRIGSWSTSTQCATRQATTGACRATRQVISARRMPRTVLVRPWSGRTSR